MSHAKRSASVRVMDRQVRVRFAKHAILLLAFVSAGRVAAAGAEQDEPYDSGWAFYADNDLLAPGHSDRDYTGGFSLTLAGRRARESWWSTDGLREGTDRLLGLASLYADR